MSQKLNKKIVKRFRKALNVYFIIFNTIHFLTFHKTMILFKKISHVFQNKPCKSLLHPALIINFIFFQQVTNQSTHTLSQKKYSTL